MPLVSRASIGLAARKMACASWVASLSETRRVKLRKSCVFSFSVTTRPSTPECFARFAARFSYVRGDLQDSAAYKRLLDELGKGEAARPDGGRDVHGRSVHAAAGSGDHQPYPQLPSTATIKGKTVTHAMTFRTLV